MRPPQRGFVQVGFSPAMQKLLLVRFSGLIRFAARKHALSARLGAAPDPSATLDLSEYHSLNCETVRPSHCSHGELKRRGTYSTLKCRQPPLSCCKCLGDVRFYH